MADFAAVVKELESQNKVLGDIKRNTAKPKKDAGDREVEKETAKRDGQTNVLLNSILGEIKGGGLGKAKSGGDKKGGGFSFGKLKLGAIGGGIAGLAAAIMGFIMNPFGLLLKAGKWVLKAPFRLAAWSIKKLATGASNAIGSALKKGWGFLKDFSAPKLKALGSSIKTLATEASNSIKNGLKAGWGFAKNMTMKAADIAKTGMNFLKDLGSKAMTGLKGGLKTAWGFAKAKGDKVGKIAVKLAKTGKKFLTDLGTKALGGLKTGLTNAWSTTVNLAKTGKDSLLNLAKSASTNISNAVSGLWQGAKGKGKKVIDLATQLTKAGITKASHGVGMLKTFAVNGAKAVKSGLGSVMGKITGIVPGAGKKKVGLMIGKALLGTSKLIPGAGLAIAGAAALYSGFKSGFDTYKKTGNFSKAVKDGSAAAVSSLTFGLVSKETISNGFDAIGSQYTKLTDGVVKVAGDAWTGVKKLIPTKAQMTAAWNAVGKKLAPLKDITLPKEFSVEAVKTSLSSVGTALNGAVKNMTGLDISNIVTKFPKLSDISALLPSWLTAPAKWLAGWFKTSKVPDNPEELKSQAEADSIQKELAKVQKQQRIMSRDQKSRNSRMEIKKLKATNIAGEKWLATKGKGGTDLDTSVWSPIDSRKYDAAGIAEQKKKVAANKKKIKEHEALIAKQDANKAAVQKRAKQLQAALDKNLTERNKLKLNKKQTGGSFSGFDPFIAHEGELIMPRQSSGLVLNRAATNAIMSAGMNRLAAANQGDVQGGGGSPTLINAPKVTNSTTTQTAVPIRRPLPIVQSMVG